MELYIIRHGQSTNNVSMLRDPNDRQYADPPLTELGHQQAQAVAEYVGNHLNVDVWVEKPPESRETMQGFGITRLYCSPMLRALQTCLPISQAIGIQPEVMVDIHEHGGMFLQNEKGDIIGYTGLTRTALQGAFPNYLLPDHISEQGWWNPANGYEDLAACKARAMRVSANLRLQAGSAQRIGLVTHGTFADALVKAFLNLLPGDELRFFHYNTAITRIDFRNDGKTILRYLNRIEHLTPELMS